MDAANTRLDSRPPGLTRSRSRRRMSGAELAELIHEVKPGVPVLHMSGYNAGALSQQPATGAKITLLEKPFTAETLLETVRAALDAP